MAEFMVHFILCNIFISGFIGILIAAKRIFHNSLTSRMQYHLWLLLLGLLAVPFLPLRLAGRLHLSALSIFANLSALPETETSINKAASTNLPAASNWMNDFTVSAASQAAPAAGWLAIIWIAGIFVMILFTFRSWMRLRILKKSALPLQNHNVSILYANCLEELGITRKIPVYSTAFLKSPMILGFLMPKIYLPVHLVSDQKASDIRYIFLHELQHYRHKDVLTGYLMNLAGILYWFHPLVWFALKEMQTEREVACDASVLQILGADLSIDYGDTLIRFAEKISLTPFPFTASLSTGMRQLKRRILHIASYEEPTFRKNCKSIAAFALTAALLAGLSPVLSTYAASSLHYRWDTASETIALADLSDYFREYEGSFVLYNLEQDSWTIYNIEHALARVSPDSTYKIYDALFALEEGIITPENSYLAWDQTPYPFDAWNAGQTLDSAMQASVNWYFQSMDAQLGKARISSYIQDIGYGNQNTRGGLSSYWLESSLQISSVEQTQLLVDLHRNGFGFHPENIAAVKNAICLSSSEAGTIYGKTGTGAVNGHNTNGWFIGYIETTGNTYFFATNIRADENARGSTAAEITMSILSDMDICSSLL